MSALVAITIVTYNSAPYIGRCLEFALAQAYPQIRIVVVDNASADGTRDVLRAFEERIQVVYNDANTGFAGGQNQAIAAVPDAGFVLTLNPDVRLTSDFVTNAVAAARIDETVGSVCGKLLAISPSFAIPASPIFDSTGIYMTPNLRHFDRGSRLPDRGQYDNLEYVFGGTGAACLYRRAMIEDLSVRGEFFDSDFFAYREDADVAWRAQLLGWKCVYTPAAVAYHVRSVTPENRRSLPAVINMHSVKNRWLLRMKNMTADLYRRHWLAVTCRDAIVIGGCLLFETSSLRGFLLAFQYRKRMRAKRQEIMQRRRASDAYIASWFSYEPVSYPVTRVGQAPSPAPDAPVRL
jgi:GT2 family glycosyltransferase